MMRIWIAFLFGLLSLSVFAIEEPKGARLDGRIQTITYKEQEVVRINAHAGVATQIIFSEEEEILDIASGFSDGWELNNRRNQLYLKPKPVKQSDRALKEPTPGIWNTNVIVTTNLHVYAFQLELKPDVGDYKVGQDQKIAFRITFQYPEDKAKKKQLLAQEQMLQKRLDQDETLDATYLNWNYFMKVGKKSQHIAPSSAYDDGRFTYLKFPSNQDFPAIFLVGGNRSESVINTHIDPKKSDTLVVHQVAPQMRLRLGQQVISIFNKGYRLNRPKNLNGTTVNGVKRSLASYTKETHK